jgi:hypothetical protein
MMKVVLLAMVVMAVLPPSEALVVLPFAVVVALLALLGRREYPTFETVTSNREMALAADPRLTHLAEERD